MSSNDDYDGEGLDDDLDDYQPPFLLKAALVIALFSPFILFGIYGILR